MSRYNTPMHNLFTRFRPVLLAVFLAASMLSAFAQTTSGSAEKSASKKTAHKVSSTPSTPKKTVSQTMTLTTPEQKLSYALGADMGKRLKATQVPVDPAVLERGMSDAMTGKASLMTDDEIRSTIASAQKDLQMKQMAKMKEMGDKNKKEGDAFLAANKSKEGVVTLPSGLQYKILKSGDGPKPTAADTVSCNYRGTLIDGKEFDSSYKRGQPASFPVGGVIKGWTEALQLMPVGSKWQLFIPPDLAYGERGAGADIEPNSTLVFEVELLSIQAKNAPPATPAAPSNQ
jgi:FKBP-type peptidyl-prolyl cis-trans isomerase FklB